MITEEQAHENQQTSKFICNVLIKGVLLFIILNFMTALIPAGSSLGRLSLYNHVLPGRVRLPFGENPQQAYNLSLYDLEVMFASHEIEAGPKPDNEFRIILIGDSAAWGILLEPQNTLAGLINRDDLKTADGKAVRAYNLAYPSMSLLKDLIILEKALTYQPDLIIWPVTLQSFPNKVQIETPLVANNPNRAKSLIEAYDLPLNPESDDFVLPTFWDKTLIGRRRAILDAIQLQLYGVLWAATGIDQTYPEDYTPAQLDFEKDDSFVGWYTGALPLNQLATNILKAGVEMAGEVPVLVVNEPILISNGENSDIRYNFFYPRWAYDQYRLNLVERSVYAAWSYVDLWDIIPPEEFTNSAVHLTPEGSLIYYQALKPTLARLINQ